MNKYNNSRQEISSYEFILFTAKHLINIYIHLFFYLLNKIKCFKYQHIIFLMSIIAISFNPSDENECEIPNSCHSNATCTNTDGSYTCACDTGYIGDGFMCTNVNECDDPTSCHENATCEDTPGSSICTCLVGFSGDGITCTSNT